MYFLRSLSLIFRFGSIFLSSYPLFYWFDFLPFFRQFFLSCFISRFLISFSLSLSSLLSEHVVTCVHVSILSLTHRVICVRYTEVVCSSIRYVSFKKVANPFIHRVVRLFLHDVPGGNSRGSSVFTPTHGSPGQPPISATPPRNTHTGSSPVAQLSTEEVHCSFVNGRSSSVFYWLRILF